MAEPDIRQAERMSKTEALMWIAEADPYLSSAMGSLFVLDVAPDFERFLETMRCASHTLSRLRERVEPGTALAPPRWVIDPEFDIEEHVRLVKLPGAGDLAELRKLTASIFQDPFDPNRPLWQFVVVEGAKAKRAIPGAIILKLHHSVSDGIGALRLAEMYLDLERNPPVRPEPVTDGSIGEPPKRGPFAAVLDDLGYVAGRQLAAARRMAAEVSLWGADAERARRVVRDVAELGSVLEASIDGGIDRNGGSQLWKTRSRHRVLEVFDLDLAETKDAAKRWGVSINDLFVAGSVLGAARYHAERNSEVAAFNLSFITSTRTDEAAAGNSFVPVPFSASGELRSIEEHLTEVRDSMAEALERLSESGLDIAELLSGFVTLLPPRLLTRAGRRRAARQDWATSNLRGAPFPIYVAGGKVDAMYPVGPVAGTAFNLTAMSYDGSFHFGVHIDPSAVEDPVALSATLQEAYADLLVLE